MSLTQMLLLALIVVAIIFWRLQDLLEVLRGKGSTAGKIAIGGIIVLGLASRVSRFSDAFGDVAGMSRGTNTNTPSVAARPTVHIDSAQGRRAAEAEALAATGLQALEQCDTATANHSFEKVAAVGIQMMDADSTAGDPLFYQGVALAGLRDTVNAAMLTTEAARLDRLHHVPGRSAHAALLQRVSTLAYKKC